MLNGYAHSLRHCGEVCDPCGTDEQLQRQSLRFSAALDEMRGHIEMRAVVGAEFQAGQPHTVLVDRLFGAREIGGVARVDVHTHL